MTNSSVSRALSRPKSTPSIKNGERIKPRVAPTRRITSISSRRAVIAARIELTMANSALESSTIISTEPTSRKASLIAKKVSTASPPSSTSATPGSARNSAATRAVCAGSESRRNSE